MMGKKAKHVRSKHTRRQRYGKGNQQIKFVEIAETIVNKDKIDFGSQNEN